MRGLYLITNDDPIELLLAKLEGAMATYEVAVLQYRRKNVPQTQQAYEIEYMKSMCDQYKVPFVINDDLETAVKYGVGVHLGQEDGSIVEAVARLPQDVLIGRSCNNSIELAEQAIAVRERGPAAKPLSRQDPAARAARAGRGSDWCRKCFGCHRHPHHSHQSPASWHRSRPRSGPCRDSHSSTRP